MRMPLEDLIGHWARRPDVFELENANIQEKHGKAVKAQMRKMAAAEKKDSKDQGEDTQGEE